MVFSFEGVVAMINSMTGYGEAAGEINGVTYTVEIRTVNNRYLKTSTRLPDSVAFLEEDIDKLLRRNLSRGTVNYVLRIWKNWAGLLPRLILNAPLISVVYWRFPGYWSRSCRMRKKLSKSNRWF